MQSWQYNIYDIVNISIKNEDKRENGRKLSIDGMIVNRWLENDNGCILGKVSSLTDKNSNYYDMGENR